MRAAEEVGSTWIVQAGEYARNVGVALAPIEPDSDWGWERVDLRETQGPASAEVSELVATWGQKVEARFEEPVGVVETDLIRAEKGQTRMGRWASDLVRHTAAVDVGVYNRGGLRADLVAGEISLLDLYRVFPFGNEVVSFEWTGRQLEAVVELGLTDEMSADPAVLQWSGIRYHWVVTEGSPHLTELWIGDERVDPERVYTIGTNVFVGWQWESLLGVPPRGELVSHGLTVFEAAEAAARAGPLRAPVDKRSLLQTSP